MALLAGCKVDARVDVTLNADGSGTVLARITLDAEAVHRLTTGGPLATAVPLDDLRTAGWHVSLWTTTKSGAAQVTLSRAFVNQDDLARRLEDLTGPHGALRDARITRTRGFFGASDKISLTVDLRDVRAGVKSDSELAKRLAAAGIDVNALDTKLDSELKGALRVTVRVRAPGEGWQATGFRGGGHGSLFASHSETYVRRIMLLAIGGAVLVLALVVMGLSLRSRSRPSRGS